MEILSVKDLDINVGGRKVLSDLNFNIEEKDLVAIIGANGVGKTLLVRTLMGLHHDFTGQIHWDKDIKIGYVPQKFSIDKKLPLTVCEFIRLKKGVGEHRVHHLLRDVGLPENLADVPLSNLSGGEFQRALIAWALSDHPTVLVFDEPTASIDMAGEHAIYELLSSLKKERGITIFMVSHDLELVYNYADRVLCLANGSMICSPTPKDESGKKLLREIYGPHFHSHHN